MKNRLVVYQYPYNGRWLESAPQAVCVQHYAMLHDTGKRLMSEEDTDRQCGYCEVSRDFQDLQGRR